MKVYTSSDLARNRLDGTTVAVVGFGNQGHAHAQNLRDAGVHVVVGARQDGAGWKAATAAGFETLPPAEAAARAGVVALLLPDESQAGVFAREIEPALEPGAALVFAHGFAVAFGGMKVRGRDVVLVAPKGQGHYVRRAFVEGTGLPCMVAVETDASGSAWELALSYASSLGCLEAGAIATTFREETVSDLFGEQAVLCGGVPELVKAAFEALVARGFAAEVAYIECLHELKIITDLMFEGGLHHMRERISRTAAWGSYESGERIVSRGVRQTLAAVLDEIESGRFARGWLDEAASGAPHLAGRMRDEAAHPIEAAGRDVRALMHRAQSTQRGTRS